MKKCALFFSVLLIICFSSACNNSSTAGLNKVNHPVINSHFEQTLSSYYYEQGSSNSICIYGFLPKESPVLTAALQNEYSSNKINVSHLTETENPYYFSVLKSLILKKNNLLLDQLNEKSVQRDYFLAFHTAASIHDSALTDAVKKKYQNFKPANSDSSISGQIYKEMNDNFLHNGKTLKLKDQVIQTVKNDSEDLHFNPDKILTLNACLAYIDQYKMTDSDTAISKIYNIYMQEINQKYMLAQSEMYAAVYIENINYMKHCLHLPTSDHSFFNATALNSPLVYKGVVYDVTSPRNLAFYLTALADTSNDLSEQQLKTLYNIINTQKQNTRADNYAAQFYIKLSCGLLNLDYSTGGAASLPKSTRDWSLSHYYEYKLNNVKIDGIKTDSGDILSELASMDIENNKNIVKSSLEHLKILEYQNSDDFDVILNFYTGLILDNGLADTEIKNKIETYIKSKECDYGYCSDRGNYDFEASVYYTNILNMLNEGRSNGLR